MWSLPSDGLVRVWHRLPREVMDTPLQAGGTLSTPIYLWVSLFIAGELNQIAFKDLFHLKKFCDSMKKYI